MKYTLKSISTAILFSIVTVFSVTAQKSAPTNWFNLDSKSDKVIGVSSEKSYKTLLKGKTSQSIVVAVIDGGTDINHEDLREVVWTNKNEIPGNGIDDDSNGYIDDIHGWNFIGGKDGKNVGPDNLELTRLYRYYNEKFGNKGGDEIGESDKNEFEIWQNVKTTYETEKEKDLSIYPLIKTFCNFISDYKAVTGKSSIDEASLKSYTPTTDEFKKMRQSIFDKMKDQSAEEKAKSFAGVNSLFGGCEQMSSQANFHYNLDFDPRPIVGDNYYDLTERFYGNNDVKGPDAGHGTHVAGIIAAARNNGIGMNGVADNVKIMVVRVVPDGDERDKDVANGIRYAVDNGAKIINMSFGKSFNWNKKVVDEAVAYAAEHNVLLIHAAGNDANNIDITKNFPNDTKEGTNEEIAQNWIEVGASSWEKKKHFTADFSNYGKTTVDVFSPGVAIYSTTPESKYESFDGTSMAAPVCAGVAALVWSYNPTLTAVQLKSIILKSSVKYKSKVYIPGTNKTTKLSKISKTGGVVNAYNALKLAATYK